MRAQAGGEPSGRGLCINFRSFGTVGGDREGDTFSENEAIYYGGYTRCRLAYVNYQRGTLPCGETGGGFPLGQTKSFKQREVVNGRV